VLEEHAWLTDTLVLGDPGRQGDNRLQQNPAVDVETVCAGIAAPASGYDARP